TYYTDMYWISASTVRVVYRGYHYANANGGVSNANAISDASYASAYGGVSIAYASYDASHAHAHVGSRLAFRGKIVRAQSVAAYKAIREVA
uniref:hypothetical protein n=1 Tax=Phocaeicola plebeius TaxID=310297 RepID=UPI003AB697E4